MEDCKDELIPLQSPMTMTKFCSGVIIKSESSHDSGLSSPSFSNQLNERIQHEIMSQDSLADLFDVDSPCLSKETKWNISCDEKENLNIPRGETSSNLVQILSSLYGKVIVVMGVAFPLSEIISDVPLLFYEAFYLYLYFCSIIFILFVYLILLPKSKICKFNTEKSLDYEDENMKTSYQNKAVELGGHCGSFYLRLGAIAFGIGSMIYSCLEFGIYFEMNPFSSCYNIHHALSPIIQMLFTFIQLYFIFMNSKLRIIKYPIICRFGLMHMVATNLCVWLEVLVQETKHEIIRFLDEHAHELHINLTNDDLKSQEYESSNFNGSRCFRSTVMTNIVRQTSPFLYPCSIEYSLICAAILYIMWKNVGKPLKQKECTEGLTSAKQHRYSVDCGGANKGLFLGILIVVMTIINLILFFVFINRPKYRYIAVYQAQLSDIALYTVMLIAVSAAFVKMRHLFRLPSREGELDKILLIIGQSGVYLFAIFLLIGGHHSKEYYHWLLMVTPVLQVVQSTFQTVFILDAYDKIARNFRHARDKPGREAVTFLIICNFSMWAMHCLKNQRSDSNPATMDFFGFWGWAIISNISIPMSIFYRFHCTVCLFEIWKNVYKSRAETILRHTLAEA